MDDQPRIDDSPSQDGQRSGRLLAGASSWLASAALHATTLMVMATVYYMVAEQEEDLPPSRIATIATPPIKEVKHQPRIADVDRPQFDLPVQCR